MDCKIEIYAMFLMPETYLIISGHDKMWAYAVMQMLPADDPKKGSHVLDVIKSINSYVSAQDAASEAYDMIVEQWLFKDVFDHRARRAFLKQYGKYFERYFAKLEKPDMNTFFGLNN